MLLENIELIHKIKSIFAPDGRDAEHNTTENTLGFGLIHYAFITNIRPKRVLAIGSRYGYIPAIISLALKANGEGKLDFVDASYSDEEVGYDVAFGGVSNWSDENNYKSGFEQLGLLDIINFNIMRTDEFFPKCELNYEYIYIDGNHGYEGSKYDFDESAKRLTTDGIIAMHDMYHPLPPFGVARTFLEIDETKYNKMIIPVGWPFDKPTNDDNGLALIQPKYGEEKIKIEVEKTLDLFDR